MRPAKVGCVICTSISYALLAMAHTSISVSERISVHKKKEEWFEVLYTIPKWAVYDSFNNIISADILAEWELGFLSLAVPNPMGGSGLHG